MDAIGLAARDIVSGAADQGIAGGADCAISLNILADFVNGGGFRKGSCQKRPVGLLIFRR
jgi:3-oxoacyl-(acyl-carrier-protein) synthase